MERATDHLIPLPDEIGDLDGKEAKEFTGKRIREARQAAGATAQQLAESMDPPVTTSAVTSWERGRTTPSPEARDRIEALYGEELRRLDERNRGTIMYAVVSLDDDRPDPVRLDAEDRVVRTMTRLSSEGLRRLAEYGDFLADRYPVKKGGGTAGRRG